MINLHTAADAAEREAAHHNNKSKVQRQNPESCLYNLLSQQKLPSFCVA